MAKGNMFQGQARGSVGDVTFYRMDGKQISRVRNRYPHNPKTNAQLYQRAIIATAMRAYSAGKEIFDHSFEGKKVGMGNMREFLRLNSAAIRQALKYDVDVEPTGHLSAIVNAPKTNTPVPNQYIVSSGSLQNNFIQWQDPSAAGGILVIKTPEALDGESVAEYAARVGLKQGDIYTFVGFTINKSKTVFSTTNGIGAGGYQEYSSFFFVRLIVNAEISATTPAEDALFGSIFAIDATANVTNIPLLESNLAGLSVNADTALTIEEDMAEIAVIGCIRSQVNSMLRSNETLHWVTYNNVYGIDWQNLLLAWTKEPDSLGNSDLILEGGGSSEQGANPSSPAGITAEGNFLAVVDNDGIKKIAQDSTGAVQVAGGNVQVAMDSNQDASNLRFNLHGSYVGALGTQSVELSVEEYTPGPMTGAVGVWVIKAGNQTFKTANMSADRVSGFIYNIPLSAFKLA